MSVSREKFVRLAESRTSRILKDIDLLSNLSNRSNYSFSAEDIRKIFGALNSSIKECQSRFENNLKSQSKNEFKL